MAVSFESALGRQSVELVNLFKSPSWLVSTYELALGGNERRILPARAGSARALRHVRRPKARPPLAVGVLSGSPSGKTGGPWRHDQFARANKSALHYLFETVVASAPPTRTKRCAMAFWPNRLARSTRTM